MTLTPQRTARKVLDQIETRPDTHDQDRWQAEAPCGTTRCVGGWTLHLHGKDDLLEMRTTVVFDGREILLRAYEAGTPSLADEAGRLLGLDYDDAEKLFYETTNEEAVTALRYLARGERIDWAAVYGEVAAA